MALIAPQQVVPGAARSPLPYGIFSHLQPRDGQGVRWENGVSFETLTCEPAAGIGAPDCDPAEVIGLPKSLGANSGGTVSTSPFTIYGHWTCSPVGTTPEEAQEKASAHLIAREAARVEQAIWTGDLGNTPTLRSAEVIGAATFGMRRAVARLEQEIAARYGSLGVIHMTREAALIAIARGVVDSQGTRLFTELGTPVIAGAGYDGSGPTGAPAPAEGETWIYATPALLGYRGEVFTSSDRPGDLLDRSRNDLYAIAERTYTIGWEDCGVVAIRASLSESSTPVPDEDGFGLGGFGNGPFGD